MTRNSKSSREKMRDRRQISYLPTEIITIIFVCMPVRTLLQCRSVCKEWLSIISNPTFVASQLKWAKEKANLALKRHIVFDKVRPDTNDPPRVRSMDYQSLDPVIHTWPFPTSYQDAEILASCNGMLLIGVGENDCFLWNPSTRVHRKLEGKYCHFRQFVRLHGVGYDCVSHAYKVLRIVRVSSSNRPALRSNSLHDRYDSTNVHVFNSITGLWKMITKDKFPYQVFSNRRAIFVNGGLYTIAIRADGETLKHVIVCFDLAKEKFVEVESPSWLGDGCNCTDVLLNKCNFELVDLHGSLCLIRYSIAESVVWMMNEDGSWTRFLAVPYVLGYPRILPLCLRDNENELLLDNTNNVVAYNLEADTRIEMFRFSHIALDDQCLFNTAQYLETLVSPK